MTDPTLDQIAAAQVDARNVMKTTLGSDGPPSGTSPIIERYLVRLPLDNRCAHLRAVPLQRMFLPMPTDLWRCRGKRRFTPASAGMFRWCHRRGSGPRSGPRLSGGVPVT
ncbi:hypothetical protein [Streptomyces niveus]|uniref:hypothetical protein n=1 Tax=Streptomyces niveus TaxID=193462 RepID=UPI0036E28CD3